MTWRQSRLREIAETVLDAHRIGWLFPLRHVAAALGRPDYTSPVAGFGPFRIRARSSDAAVVRQVFSKREYDLSGFHQFAGLCRAYDRILAAGLVPLILDAGANIGAAAVWFARQFPQAHVIAVEPDPANAECCRFNTRLLGNVSVIEGAVGSVAGHAALSNPSGEAWAVQTGRVEGDGVPIHALSDLLGATGCRPFIVKIDIEGFEADLFGRDTEWLDRIEALLIEPHDWMLPGAGSSRTFQRAMARHEFEIFVKGENIIYIRLPNRVSDAGAAAKDVE